MTGVSGLRGGLALALAWTMLVSVEVTRAQAPPASPPVADQPSNAGEPQAVPVSTPVGGRSLPPFPGVFSRGNHLPHPRSVIRQGGGNYFNVFLCVPLLGLFFLWTWTCYWVDDDSQAL